jgi:hypothetical protein
VIRTIFLSSLSFIILKFYLITVKKTDILINHARNVPSEVIRLPHSRSKFVLGAKTDFMHQETPFYFFQQQDTFLCAELKI